MTKIVDVDAMYKAGYSSAYRPSLQPYRNELIDQVFRYAGQTAVAHYQNAFKELAEVKRKSNSAASAIEMEIEKVGDQLNPQVQNALDAFKKEYDKGARMAKLGITGKRKSKGQEMMDAAMLKMTTLNSHLEILKVKRKEEQDRANLMNGDSGHDDGKVKMYNSGAGADAIEYSAMMASGNLLNHMQVNLETGELELLEMEGTGEYEPTTKRTDVSNLVPSSAGDYSGGFGGQEIPTMPGTSTIYFEQGEQAEMTTKDPAEYDQGQEILKPVTTKLQDIQFAAPEDDSLQDVQRAIMESQYKDGLGGSNGERDEMLNSMTLDKIRGHVNDASNDALKSYFFGGTLVDGTKSKLPESAPVYQYLLGQGYTPGSEEWQGALEGLKIMNFSKGSDMRETVAQFMYQKANEFYDNGYEKYLSRQKTQEAKRRQQTGQADKVLNVDGSGQYMNRSDARKKAKAMTVKGVEFGGSYKYVNDGKGNTEIYFQTQNSETGDITWQLFESMTTNEAIKFRNLDNLGYTAVDPEVKEEQDENTTVTKDGQTINFTDFSDDSKKKQSVGVYAKPDGVSQEKWDSFSDLEKMNWYLMNEGANKNK